MATIAGSVITGSTHMLYFILSKGVISLHTCQEYRKTWAFKVNTQLAVPFQKDIE